MADCSSIQRSLAWCQGKPELPGVKRPVYYISKYDILQWPELQHDANGRLQSAAYSGDFVLRADAKWKFIDIIADKSQLTSEAQGEYPSQTQLNKLVAVHPGVDDEASAAAAYLNNNDNVFLVEDMRGAVRVVGSDKWPTKTTVAQDLGQGATGSTSTTINVEATDECPAPFYAGTIDTDEGAINPEGNPNQNTGGNTGGGNSSGGSSSGSTPSYNNIVLINGVSYSVSGNLGTITGPITSIKITGSHMNNISVVYDSNNIEDHVNPTNNGTVATWTGNVTAPNEISVHRGTDANGSTIERWFKFTVGSGIVPGPSGNDQPSSGDDDNGGSYLDKD